MNKKTFEDDNRGVEETDFLDDPEALAEDAAAADDADPTVEDLLAEAEAERDKLKDRWMRAMADAENLRKRAERDRRDAETYGGTKLARDMLSVYDNLGRALATVDDEFREKAKPLIEGLELTQRELLSVFEKHKITLINPEMGEKFDPKFHQAMFEAPVPNSTPGTVIQVMAVGFKIGDRLLRAAQVGVASKAN